MGEETLVAFGIILVLFLRRHRRRRQQRLKKKEEKSGRVQSFSKKLEEYMVSTTASSESLAWVIGNIISGKHDLTFQI